MLSSAANVLILELYREDYIYIYIYICSFLFVLFFVLCFFNREMLGQNSIR